MKNDVVKRYSEFERFGDGMGFAMMRMEEIYDQRKGKVDSPHRHDYYTVVFPLRAIGCHKIDFESYELSGNQVFFVGPGMVHQIEEKERSEGYVMIFTESFLERHGISSHFIEDLNLFQEFGQSPPLQLNRAQVKELTSWCEKMLEAAEEKGSFTDQALGALLKLFLISCNNACDLDSSVYTQSLSNRNQLVRGFKEIMEENYHQWHGVNEYAEALHISPDYLNKVLKQATGKSAKTHIQAKLILEAKRMIYFSEQSQKEIAFELGFNESSHFSAFFKKCTGMSPTAFRELN